MSGTSDRKVCSRQERGLYEKARGEVVRLSFGFTGCTVFWGTKGRRQFWRVFQMKHGMRVKNKCFLTRRKYLKSLLGRKPPNSVLPYRTHHHSNHRLNSAADVLAAFVVVDFAPLSASNSLDPNFRL